MQLKEVKELITLLNSGIHLGVQVIQDGKVGFNDMPYVLDFIEKLVPGVQGISQIPSELAQMTDQDAEDLIEFAVQDLNLPEGKAKEVVELSLKILSDLFHLVKAVRK
jgi:hypothetical protein